MYHLFHIQNAIFVLISQGSLHHQLVSMGSRLYLANLWSHLQWPVQSGLWKWSNFGADHLRLTVDNLVDQIIEAIDPVRTLPWAQQVHRDEEVLEIKLNISLDADSGDRGSHLGGNCSGTSLRCWEKTRDLGFHLLHQWLAAQMYCERLVFE